MARDNEKIEVVLKCVGKRLKEVRKLKGYTNYELFAFSHEISRSNYSGYENGKNMQLDTFIFLLMSSGTSFREFFDSFEDLPTQLP